MKLDAVVKRAWRGIADAKRIATRSGSARSALASLGTPSRGEAAAWLHATSKHHDDYRAAHPVAAGRVAVVCVSSRPHLVDAVVANVAAQTEVQPTDLDVVYVANYDVADPNDIDEVGLHGRFGQFANFRLIVPAAGTSLGHALNSAMAATDARFVAKFDDDDLYGPHHLADSLRAHGYAGAGVVGKHTYYAHLAERDETVLRFPGHEFSYSSTLAGGTLVIDRDRVGDQQFDDLSLGEDRAFLATCHRRGISTFSADRFNFTQIRSTHNTWQPGHDAFMVGTQPADAGGPEHRIDR
ncbi:hypothetical protein [Ilumatobacter coccineus]|uniref:Glycosyltransferase n=1 Tax=Ilumatobacter coccineus (strain NBRC 103263 / KCTC 29153 / YM16-304) TaxID=1313172 RepID=A0A6C7EFD0_ILUCY|nr:hypothetical protein [Ilumatobacter coccineus]BAN03318.1 hypothetical protein YM304_30040 [Ilumatobacter coccineus YM16-304]